ncbi:MAG TPA: sigma-70 family RNA polymerase sigma factor [Bryobacteraceae bacterium]|nr:sigma-70 family RNA polymerase sigma factor [Bryobacteraceae bacterium]
MKTDTETVAQTNFNSSDPSWPDLVERIHDGDPCAMEELYRVFSKGIRFFLCRQLGPQDLDDKVHDVFMIITQSIQKGELREPERLMGYVRTIVRRLVAAHIDDAVHARRNQTDLDYGAGLSDNHPNPERCLINQENSDLARRILNSLHHRDREVLVRFYLKEQTPGQICTEMQLSETQFRLIKSRAKARFGELGKRRLEMRTGFRWNNASKNI